MSEEEHLRQKKLEELKQKYLQQQEEEQKAFEAESKIQSIMKQLLDEDARLRLNNVRLVNKELYTKAIQAVIGLAQKGFLQEKLKDAQMREVLIQLKSNREISITRK